MFYIMTSGDYKFIFNNNGKVGWTSNYMQAEKFPSIDAAIKKYPTLERYYDSMFLSDKYGKKIIFPKIKPLTWTEQNTEYGKFYKCFVDGENYCIAEEHGEYYPTWCRYSKPYSSLEEAQKEANELFKNKIYSYIDFDV